MFKKKKNTKGGQGGSKKKSSSNGNGDAAASGASSLSYSSSSSHSASSAQQSLSTGRRRSNSNNNAKNRPSSSLLVRQRQPDIQSLVPRYLKPCLTHYHGDFFATAQTDAVLFAQVMVEGFLPIAAKTNDDDRNGMTIVLPKLHRERCVISPISDMHISKSVRKKSKRYAATINQNFDGVVAGCHRQHGLNWLYPEVVATLQSMHEKGQRGMEAMLFEPDSVAPVGVCPVRLYSIEVCNEASGELVAGELGYTVGSIYTSLTGFTAEDGSGSVQLAVLGTLLQKCGFDVWDMGMSMDYKERLGAHLMPRAEFVYAVRRVRAERPNVILSLERPRMNCKEILTGSSPMDIDATSVQKQGSQQKQQKQQQKQGKKKKKEKKKMEKNGKKHDAAGATTTGESEEEESHKRRKKRQEEKGKNESSGNSSSA